MNAQRDVVLDLLDAMSTARRSRVSVRAADGSARSATLDIANPAERRRLTEPAGAVPRPGLRFYEPPIPAVLGTSKPDGPAARAGLAAGDRIVCVNGEPVHDFRELPSRVQAHPGERITIRYRRGTSESRGAGDLAARTVNGKTRPHPREPAA